ncbi:hypothetical protein CRENBAI_013461 [Crenichthys baileyi]|uniref:Uncharacterized protein n=1 Tax=Crenichthys baileyi TaxID=28760 RepID=A0AAV9SII3_9TELE
MMKLLFQLCFLVLATSSVLRGQNVTSPTQVASHDSGDQDPGNLTTLQHLNQTNDDLEKAADNTSMARPTPEPSGPTSPPSSVTTVAFPGGESSEGPIDDSVSTSKSSTSSKPVPADRSSSAWGYIFLVLIIILIIALCIILFMLRRASRTYSFDLQRPAPSSNVYEPTCTFGQVYLDDLEGSAHKDVISEDLSTTPVPNGTSPPLEEKAADEENAPQEQPEASDLQNSSSSSSSSLSGDDQAEKKSNQMSSNNLFFDAAEELPQQQLNENNNNPSGGSSSPFVEINLDEPPWSDQLLTSPQLTSMVLPFSPFSFSPSSTSS